MSIDPNSKMLIDQALASVPQRQLHRVLFNLADCYNQTANQAFATIDVKQNADFAAPAIMCKSFAIELLLKFFIVTDYPAHFSKADIDAANGNLKGHTFSNLFDRISPIGQNIIAKKYSERNGVEIKPADFRVALIALGDDPFVRWRYFYENTCERYLDLELLELVVDSLGLAAQDATRSIDGLSSSKSRLEM